MNILVVDRHPVMRLGIVALLRTEDDILTIRVAENMDDAASIVATEQPDIVVLDSILEGRRSGTELCRRVHSGVVLSWAVTGKLIFMGCVVVGVGVSGSLLGV
ncbi:MAG: response regulator [Pseudonocardiaceae bacterium]